MKISSRERREPSQRSVTNSRIDPTLLRATRAAEEITLTVCWVEAEESDEREGDRKIEVFWQRRKRERGVAALIVDLFGQR